MNSFYILGLGFWVCNSLAKGNGNKSCSKNIVWFDTWCPLVNFTNILWAAFVQKLFCPDCYKRKGVQNTSVWKSCSWIVGKNLHGCKIFNDELLTESFKIVGIDFALDNIVIVKPDSIVFNDQFAQLTNDKVRIFILLLRNFVIVANEVCIIPPFHLWILTVLKNQKTYFSHGGYKFVPS